MLDIHIQYMSGQSEHLYGLKDILETKEGLTLHHIIDDEIQKEYIHYDVIKAYALTKRVEVNGVNPND